MDEEKKISISAKQTPLLVLFLVVTLVLGALIGYSLFNVINVPQVGISGADYNILLNNQNVIASYVAQEAVCVKQIQSCKIIEDSNASFVLGCLK